MSDGTRPQPMPGRYPVAYGEAELIADLDREGGWMLLVDDVPQSYVDLADPTYLEFEYVRHMADVIDSVPAGALATVHVGGGAGTLARYIAATRPGSQQVMIELDGDLVALVRQQLALDAVPGLAVTVADGRDAVEGLADGTADLVVVDAFVGARVPPALLTTQFVDEVGRLLKAEGTYLLNVADGPELDLARRLGATLSETFPHVALLADPGLLRGRRFGNLIFAASYVPLPTLSAAGDIPRARCVDGDDLIVLIGEATPLRDARDVPIPTPPASFI